MSMMLGRSFITFQSPVNEKLTGTAKAAEVNLESGLAEGEVVAAEGEAVALAPQAATVIRVAQTSPRRRLSARTGRR